MTRKGITILAAVIVLAASMGGYVWFNRNAGLPQLDGRWKLGEETEGCFTTVRFMSNPLSNNGGVSLETTEGRVVKMHYGTYVKKSKAITVSLTNPEVTPFAMTPESVEEQLKLTYNWEGKAYTCVYSANK
jgi:hypothetical protein